MHDQMAEVRQRDIPWEQYERTRKITKRELEMLIQYDKHGVEHQNGLLQKDPSGYVSLFLSLLVKIGKIEVLQYIVTIIDDIVQQPENVAKFRHYSGAASEGSQAGAAQGVDACVQMHKLLFHTDSFIERVACRIMTVLTSDKETHNPDHTDTFVAWLREQLRSHNSAMIPSVLDSLQKLLRTERNRQTFSAQDGVSLLASLLRVEGSSPQELYQTAFCVWLLTFSKNIAETIGETVIPPLCIVLKTQPKEKVIRISLATLRNLLGYQDNNEDMIILGLVKQLQTFQQKKWADEDIVADIESLLEALEKDVHVLSSWETYKKEILSGDLEWSPVHRSETFWRENAAKFESNDYHILRILITLLRNSNPRTVAIAAFDIGEFVRTHHNGKKIIERLQAKDRLMSLMTHDDVAVQKEALLAVQKMMVNNWAFLNANKAS
eukprot:TRINITY_DN2696_c0_g1_i1.p1 TRINITY_DN2696_c0_g1~~TRINITY_DN2696_c0_g1_i1.p1  ORF type:complete len:437 (-),score=108.61 TRINITY_DN2696_c0_g1_i1:151-1461(-)